MNDRELALALLASSRPSRADVLCQWNDTEAESSHRLPGWVSKPSSIRDVRIALRKTLKQNGLEHDGDLFDRAYAYIEQHY